MASWDHCHQQSTASTQTEHIPSLAWRLWSIPCCSSVSSSAQSPPLAPSFQYPAQWKIHNWHTTKETILLSTLSRRVRKVDMPVISNVVRMTNVMPGLWTQGMDGVDSRKRTLWRLSLQEVSFQDPSRDLAGLGLNIARAHFIVSNYLSIVQRITLLILNRFLQQNLKMYIFQK